MPKWLMVNGRGDGVSHPDGITSYKQPSGSLEFHTSEDKNQAIARDTYTLADLFVRIIANVLDGTTTVRTRKNTANGNQSVSILTTQTGTFQDTVNSDALADGDLFNYQVVTGGTSGDIYPSIFSCTLETASNTTPIICRGYGTEASWNITRFLCLMGGDMSNFEDVESHVQYTFRVASTLSNLRLKVYNQKLEASTIRTRVNGGNGNQSVSIPEDMSGTYEDAVNSDSISIGDLVNLQTVIGDNVFPGSKFDIFSGQIKSDSTGRQTAVTSDSETDTPQDYDETFYYPLEGNTIGQTGTELNTQCLTRMAFVAGNFFVNAPVNTTNGARTVNTRINGGDGSLSVSIGAAATGTFEDLVNSDTLIATDLYNFKSGAGGTSGSIVVQIVGAQIPFPAPPVGLENKSANMGSKMVATGLI